MRSFPRGEGGTSADGDSEWCVANSGWWRLLLCGGDGSYRTCRGRGTRDTCYGQQWYSQLQRGAQQRRVAAREPGARGPEARASSGWLKVKEAGMDDVGEQATEARTALRSLSLRKCS
jgi:hypothetical protein